MASVKDFTCDPLNFQLTSEMKQSYVDRGYVLIRGFLDKEELQNVRKALEDTDLFRTRIFELLGGEVYHYHTKLMAKDAQGVGGCHLWHQDYGYWYQNGCLFPDMLSVFLPIDPCGKANGCLQVVEGSHKCGRIDHRLTGGQQGCDMERLNVIKDKLPHLYVEMDPGDALFFHCNLLHCSDANNSDTKRWVLISAYNKATNDPVHPHHHPNYTKLHKVPDSAIAECKNYTDLSGKDFMDPAGDRTTDITASTSNNN